MFLLLNKNDDKEHLMRVQFHKSKRTQKWRCKKVYYISASHNSGYRCYASYFKCTGCTPLFLCHVVLIVIITWSPAFTPWLCPDRKPPLAPPPEGLVLEKEAGSTAISASSNLSTGISSWVDDSTSGWRLLSPTALLDFGSLLSTAVIPIT